MHRDLPVHETAQRNGERRNVLGEYGGVGHDRQIALEPLGFAGKERLEVRRPDLFFAFDQNLEVDRQRAAHAQVRLDRSEVHQHLAFVVDRAATENLAVAHFSLEGRRVPELERVGRLHVVVAVDQHGRLSRSAEPLGVRDRIAVRFQDLCMLKSGGSHALHHCFRAAPDFAAHRRVGRDGGYGDQVGQFANVAVVIVANEPDDVRTVGHLNLTPRPMYGAECVSSMGSLPGFPWYPQ